MKVVPCDELLGGIVLINHTFFVYYLYVSYIYIIYIVCVKNYYAALHLMHRALFLIELEFINIYVYIICIIYTLSVTCIFFSTFSFYLHGFNNYK